MARMFGRQMKEREQRDELLSAYLDGQLNAEERARLEARLTTDPALQADLEALRRTVALVRDLPPMPVPRNFILPQTAAARPHPAPPPRPRHAWAAPFLTAATVVASLLFAVVLAGDLAFSSMGRSALAPKAEPQEAPQLAMEPSPAVEEMEAQVEVEAEKVVAPDAAPSATPVTPELEAPAEAPPEALAETEDYEEMEEKAVEAPAPAMAGGGPVEEVTATAPALTTSPPAERAATPLPTTPPMATAPEGADEGSTEPTPSVTTEVAPPRSAEKEAEEAMADEHLREGERASIALITLWRVLEIALGLTALGLALGTILAWRARRR
jgi:anti-sigma factor RsiW